MAAHLELGLAARRAVQSAVLLVDAKVGPWAVKRAGLSDLLDCSLVAHLEKSVEKLAVH